MLLVRAVQLITAAPADIFGLSPRKGRIQPGADADLTLYDTARSTTVDVSCWQSRSRAAGRVWNGLPVTRGW